MCLDEAKDITLLKELSPHPIIRFYKHIAPGGAKSIPASHVRLNKRDSLIHPLTRMVLTA